MLNLNDKERMLLQDEKAGEELCIEKYKKYSAKDFKTALLASFFPMMPPISYLLANRIND